MRHKYIFGRVGLSGLSISLALFSLLANAQTPPPDTKLEEIVVTAQRRAENLQSVPISMSALTGAMLENLGVRDFSDFASMIPNLSVGAGTGSGGAGSGFGVSTTRSIAIRGVAGNNTTGVYLNDTPMPMSLDPRALDLDRIEVLRGPQGTLFGAGSMGGTLHYVTREPSVDQTSARFGIEGFNVEEGGTGYSADGTVNFQLSPGRIGLRVNAFSAFEPGLYTRSWGGPQDPRSPTLPYPPGGAPVGQKDHVGDEQATGLSVSLKITPTSIPGMTITPMYMYQRTDSNGYPLADYTEDNFTQTRPFDLSEAVEDTWDFSSLTLTQDVKFGRFIASGSYFHRDAFDREDLTEINAMFFWGIPYYVPAPLDSTLVTKTWTGEARFESAFKGPTQLVVGVFNSSSDRRYPQYFLAPGLDEATGFALGTDLEYTQNTPNTDRERAAFIDVTYAVTEAFQISAGVRRAHLEHEGAYTADGPLNGGPSGPPDTFSEHGEDNTAPRFTAKYEIRPHQILYASAAKGFRIGGTNSVVPPICDQDLADLGLENGDPFASDSVWSYEVGAKNSWSGDRVRSRVAAYSIDWQGIQQTVFLPCTFSIVANSGAAESKGAELEMDMALFGRLTLNLTLGYADAKITEATDQSQTVVGQPLSGVAKWSGSAAAQYTVPLGNRTAFIRGQWAYTGARTSFINAAPPAGRPLDSYSILNLRGGINQGPWELALFVRNVFDERGVVSDLLSEGAELEGRPRLFVARPRTIGLELRRDF
jgi:outer membrane receptor protein involved in Fe transport